MVMLRVKKVRYLSEYKLEILFNNRKTKIIDFKNWIVKGRGLLKPLKDIEFFRKVELDDCKYSICWPNGADFCPDVLYAKGLEVSKNSSIKPIKRIRKHLHKKRATRCKRMTSTVIK